MRLDILLTKLDSDVSLEFVLESDSHHARDGLDHCRFAVRDMANSSEVDGGLPNN